MYREDTGHKEEKIKVQQILLSIADASLDKGRTLQLTAEILPADAENKNLKWYSDNESTAVVDGNGLVTAVGSGRAEIIAESTDGGGARASCVVTVTRTENEKPNDTTDSSNGNHTDSPGSSAEGIQPGGSSGSSAEGIQPGGSSGSGPEDIQPGNPDDGDPDGSDLSIKLAYYIVEFNPNGGKSLSRKTMTLLQDDNLGILPKVQRK